MTRPAFHIGPQRRLFLSLALLLSHLPSLTLGCTNILVTPGASSDGSSMIAYNADSPELMGMLYHYPAKSAEFDKDGVPSVRKVYCWDTGAYLGEIPEAKETYNVVGNANDRGLTIGETTFGGLQSLAIPNGIIDYGSLIYLTLQRSSTAREAVDTISILLSLHGYASSGESFSIADGKEVWYMEIIGKGVGHVGAVWVALKVPDGYVSAHANQARIGTFSLDDPENCVYAEDVVTFAKEMGLYDENGKDEEFSFADAYDPLTETGARYGEARVWSIFSALTSDPEFSSKYASLAMGKDLKHRMPLWIKPSKKLTLGDVSERMRDHYENTALDFSHDIGAGPHHAPYRPRPQTWSFEDKKYTNERAVAVPKTGWNFIAQVRGWMPAPFQSLLWFGVDDSATSPRVPVYGCSTEISAAFSGVGPQDGVQSNILKFDLKKAFWVVNMVSNLAYTRWDTISPILTDKLVKYEDMFLEKVNKIDKAVLSILKDEESSKAIEFVTEFGVKSGDWLLTSWFEFYGFLFTRFRDGYEILPSEDNESCGCVANEPGFSDDWKRRIVEDTGDHYLLSDEPDDHDDNLRGSGTNDRFAPLVIDKLELKSV